MVGQSFGVAAAGSCTDLTVGAAVGALEGAGRLALGGGYYWGCQGNGWMIGAGGLNCCSSLEARGDLLIQC
jgi:hypothetical protein